MTEIDWTNCPDVESVEGRCGGQPVVKGTRLTVQAILENAEDCSPEEIATELFEGVTVEQVRRILRFARLAEAASLLEQAEAIVHRLWEEESQSLELIDFEKYDLLQQAANEIEQAAGTLAQVTYQPDADEC